MLPSFFSLLSSFTSFLHLILGISTPQSYPPPLSAAQERELFLAMSGGDATAREKLILHNLRLVSHIVRKYYYSSKNQEDLISIGTIGLIKAVDGFRHESGSKFATFAARCIQNEILMHFRSQKKLAAEVSLCDAIDVDRDGNPLTYIDVIASEESMDADVAKKLTCDRAVRLINTVLDPRQRRVITLRYGLGGTRPLTQRQVAERMKISRSYVSRIEKSALTRLRSLLSL